MCAGPLEERSLLPRKRDHQIGKELSFVLENSILTEREMKIVQIIHFLKNTQSQAQPYIGKSHSRGSSVKTLTTGGNAIFIFSLETVNLIIP